MQEAQFKANPVLTCRQAQAKKDKLSIIIIIIVIIVIINYHLYREYLQFYT